MSSLEFYIPTGVSPDSTTGLKTYGVYLERSTYTSMDLLIGNGPSSTGPNLATGLIYVKEHGTLSIQNTAAEGFYEDVRIDGNTRNAPINLMNNAFLNGVTVKDATVFSSGNQYSAINNNGAPAIAKGAAQIYSFGDKYCTEGSACDEGRGYTLQDNARVIFSSTQNKNVTSVPFFMNNFVNISRDIHGDGIPNLSVMSPNFAGGPLLRLGRGLYYYDMTRSEAGDDIGYLQFVGNQSGFGGYTFRTQGGSVKVNYDGSVTFGSKAHSGLGLADNGAMVYCSNCQQTNPCSSGSSGAMAKRLNGIWDCN